MSNHEPIDFPWLAERFVLDELDELESLECERLLESNQEFREAVARAVELLDATSQATRRAAEARTSSRSWVSLVAGMSVGVAASLLVALAVSLAGLVQWGPRLAGNHSPEEAIEASEDPSIVREWSRGVRLDESEADAVDALPTVVVDETTSFEFDPPSPWLAAIAKLPEDAVETVRPDGSDG